MIRLTKKSKTELYNCHPGSGVLFVNIKSNEYSKIDIHLGRDGNWYSGNIMLIDYLKIVKADIMATDEWGKGE